MDLEDAVKEKQEDWCNKVLPFSNVGTIPNNKILYEIIGNIGSPGPEGMPCLNPFSLNQRLKAMQGSCIRVKNDEGERSDKDCHVPSLLIRRIYH